MQLKIHLLVLSIACAFGSIQCAPKNASTVEIEDVSPHDINKFDTVYLQRQNGTENWRVNLKKIVLFLSPPSSLFAPLDFLSGASLLDWSKEADDQKQQKTDDSVGILHERVDVGSKFEHELPVKKIKKKSGLRRYHLGKIIRSFIPHKARNRKKE